MISKESSGFPDGKIRRLSEWNFPRLALVSKWRKERLMPVAPKALCRCSRVHRSDHGHERFPEIEEGRVNFKSESGRIGYILLWILGVPIPVLLLIYALRGCT